MNKDVHYLFTLQREAIKYLLQTCTLLNNSIGLLRKDVNKLQEQWTQRPPLYTVSCEVCGCLITKVDAIKGKSEIKKKIVPCDTEFPYPEKEYIYHPYYCKIHAPKGVNHDNSKKRPSSKNSKK